jgi:hypothetical protein
MLDFKVNFLCKFYGDDGDKETQSIKKLVPHIVGFALENTLADSPNDSLINPQIWRGGFLIHELIVTIKKISYL